MKLYLNSLIVAVVSFLWSYIYYADGLWAEDYTRPFVYRQLVPLLARWIEFLGVPCNVALIVVMTLSGVGFYLAMRVLATEFYSLNGRLEIYLLVGTLASMLVLGIFRKPYDLMTACLFSLALYYIYTVRVWKYLLVLFLSSMNRETSFLLILLSSVFWLPDFPFRRIREVLTSNWLKLVLSQLGIFLLVTFALRWVFAGTEGSDAWIEPTKNLLKFVHQTGRTILHLSVTGFLLWWMSRGWEHKSYYLRFAFGLFAPLLLLMYVVFGQAFEIRVFWEISPLVIILSLPKGA